MKAIVQDTYGTADVLRFDEVDRPAPGHDQVLVQVRAAGVDPGVWHLMTGRPYLVRAMGFGLRKPKNRVPGSDVAGVVEAVGEDVTRFRPGEEVFGVAQGSFAEYALAAEDKLAQAGEPDLRAGRGRAHLGPRRTARSPRQGADPTGAESPHHRRGRRRGLVRGSAGPSVRGARHRGVQRDEGGHGAIARGRRSYRLHEG